jgi:hypothetical protein
MTQLSTVLLPSGDLQVFQGLETLWQTSPTAWTQASFFLPTTFTVNAIAACCNADGIPQVWVVGAYQNESLAIYTTHKSSTARGASWTALSELSSAPGAVTDIFAARSASGRIQLFATVVAANVNSTTLKTTWQAGPNTYTSFEAWQDFSPTPPALSNSSGIRFVTLADGLLQLWSYSAADELLTCHKSGTEINAPWTAWEQVSPSPAGIRLISAGLGPNGQVQLWFTSPGVPIFTAFQTNPPSTSIELGTWALPAEAKEVIELAVATLSDGRLQLFIWATSQNSGSLYTQYQTGTSAGAMWSSWQKLN